MTVLSAPVHHVATETDHLEEPSAASLLQAPSAPLLEYHGDVDPDVHYIPKVTVCFAAGALAMGICLNIVAALLLQQTATPEQLVYNMIMRMAFVFGITGVGSSLLLVGLKVRDDHSAQLLFAKHWLVSLGTGAAFSIIVWGPWLVAERGVSFNRFAAAGIWMCLMAFPGIAAFWVVRPRQDLLAIASR